MTFATRRKFTFEPDQSVADEALAAMDAADLREVVREVLLELDRHIGSS